MLLRRAEDESPETVDALAHPLPSDVVTSPLPFLKWAGGKRWLPVRYPELLPKEFNRYVEPFLGGGAVFFHLCPQAAILSDANSSLVNAYIQIRDNWRKVQSSLNRHQRAHSSEYFYLERDKKRRSEHEKAAQFLYLNRTCWNGLYRVNKSGKFNVPIGTKTSVILPSDDFKSSSSVLNRAQIYVSDFESTINVSGPGDFVFVDPPYVTKHNLNGFLKYNQQIFSWSDQERLANSIRRASLRGVKVLITNADHDSVRKLYEDIGQIITLNRHSVLAGSVDHRSATTEIAVLVNYRAGPQS